MGHFYSAVYTAICGVPTGAESKIATWSISTGGKGVRSPLDGLKSNSGKVSYTEPYTLLGLWHRASQREKYEFAR